MHVTARVSTKAQLLDRQIHALTEAGCIRIFSDKKSGKNAEREELWKALDYLRPGDTLVVPSLDRLGRSIQDLIALVSGLHKRGVGFTSLHENLDTTTPGGRLVFHVFAALAEFSANSSSRALTRAWTPPAPAAPAWAAPQR
jgi:DNA invertase Pin-like site-specific DNA recombinase